jgi:hypothetical protein
MSPRATRKATLGYFQSLPSGQLNSARRPRQPDQSLGVRLKAKSENQPLFMARNSRYCGGVKLRWAIRESKEVFRRFIAGFVVAAEAYPTGAR